MKRPATIPKPTHEQTDWDLIVRLLRIAWQYRLGCIKVLCLQLCLLSMGLLGLGLTGVAIDVLSHELLEGAAAPNWPLGIAPPEDWPTMRVIFAIAGGVLVLAFTRAFLNGWYTMAMAGLLQGRIVVDLRARIFDKMQRLGFDFYDSNTTSSLINRVTGDVQNVRLFVDGVVMQTLILLLSLIIYLVYMLSINVTLTVVCLATTPGIYLLTRRFSHIVQPAYRKEREMFDEVVLNISETIQGMHVVKGFAREPREIERFDASTQRLTEHKQWIFWQVSVYPPLIGFLTHVNLMILIGLGGYMVVQGTLPLGTGMVVFAGLLQQFSGQVTNLANVANSMQQSMTAARRVFEVLDAPTPITSAPDALALERAEGRVSFCEVWFEYEPGMPVLEDVNLNIEPGQCVAILGATGAGKTTLLSLVPRFYDPMRGQVLIDGIDVRRLNLDDLRRNIGIVFQESFLFSASVADNIAFGHPCASREQIEQAAKIAAAHDFIMSLPHGYDTVLHEAGADLSGGQRQRLAIARAILLQPPILLLDDPTAAIDPLTEEEILSAMQSAMQGRTTFVIAHRLSTLKRADFIVVMQQGRIVEVGTHDVLMARKGTYGSAAILQVADDVTRAILDQNHTPAPGPSPQ